MHPWQHVAPNLHYFIDRLRALLVCCVLDLRTSFGQVLPHSFSPISSGFVILAMAMVEKSIRFEAVRAEEVLLEEWDTEERSAFSKAADTQADLATGHGLAASCSY